MGRSPCCDKARVKRGPWSQEEDAILRSFVQRFGNAGNWIALPQKAGTISTGLVNEELRELASLSLSLSLFYRALLSLSPSSKWKIPLMCLVASVICPLEFLTAVWWGVSVLSAPCVSVSR
jgi:hypothetical protein